MTPVFALWFALFAAQATAPATPPPSQPPAAQPAQPPSPAAPATRTPDQTVPSNAPSPSPNPNPKVSGIVHRSVTPPKCIYQRELVIPKEARNAYIKGFTTVTILINVEGAPENAHITKSIADTMDQKYSAAALLLDQAALDAVKKYKFKPAMENGKPLAVILNVQVAFPTF
jgi:TonB family protein